MVYFVQIVPDGPIKIGYSSSPVRRVASLQINIPSELKLLGHVVGDKSVESDLHEKFSEFKIKREWYKPDQVLLNFIAKNTVPLDFELGRESDSYRFSLLFQSGQIDKLRLLSNKTELSVGSIVRRALDYFDPALRSLLSGASVIGVCWLTTSGQVQMNGRF